jgi:predicted ATPase/DNA-binding CsgD family transcriptional regulator
MGLPTSGSGNLPVQLTRFFGREAETAELEGVLAQARLVTLTGAPGCGKSRLGIEVGQHLAPRSRDGVWLVELAPVADPERVAGAVGFVLEIGERADRSMPDAICDALADRELLLVLDNCEHVAAAAAELTGQLVERCPSVRVLATSRLPLGLPGERVWAVAPLTAEPAVELFVDRARLLSNDFRVGDSGREQISRVCDRLDGLPLAIELAAAWTRVLPPAQIADRLDDALTLLATAGRTASPRQETMEATVDWSYQLLLPVEQRLFARLSVFAGGFDLAAVEAVAGPDQDALTGITALVDHSLVQVEPAPGGSMRYRMLEPLRQYGAAVLAAGDERDEIRHCHAEHYLDVAQGFDAALRAGRRPEALRGMEREEGNFVAALEWAATQPSDLGLRLCAALAQFAELRGPVSEWRARMEEMLKVDTSDRRLRASVLSGAARLAWRQNEYGRARTLLEESLAIAYEFDDRPAVARRMRTLALVSMFEGDLEAAVELCEQSIAIFQTEGEERGLASSLIHLGWARYIEGDLGAGDAQMREALAISRARGYDTTIALSLLGLLFGAQLAKDLESARRYLVDALAAARDSGMAIGTAGWLWASAVFAADEGRSNNALRLVGGAEALSRRLGNDIGSEFMDQLRQPRLDPAFDAVGSEASARLVAEGSRMSLDELIAEAVAEPASETSGPLSRREREVADRVARGLTNAEIAEDLFISKRTVETHVDHIKQKLGHGSRSQVMAWALRESLDS